MKPFYIAVAAALVLGAAAYACLSSSSADNVPFPPDVQPLTSVVDLPDRPDHLVVAAFGLPPQMLDSVADSFNGNVEFFLADADATSVMQEMDVENLPTVRFIHKGIVLPAAGDRVFGMLSGAWDEVPHSALPAVQPL